MDIDQPSINDVFPNEILIKIFSLMDADALCNCCLVCSQWLNLIGNSLHTYTKIPLRIDSDNFEEITANKMLRQYKNKLIFSSVKFSDIADNKYIHQLIQQTNEIKFDLMDANCVRSILDICRHISKVQLINPQLDGDEYATYEPCWSSRVKRMKLDTVVLDSLTVHLGYSRYLNNWHLLQVFQELAIAVKSINLTVNFDAGFDRLEEVLDYIKGAYGNVLTDVHLMHELQVPEFTNLVDYLIEWPELRLRTFSNNRNKSNEQLIRLLDHQPFINNLDLQRGNDYLSLLEYAVEKMPHLETLKLTGEPTKEELKLTLDSLNAGKFKHMKHLYLSGFLIETMDLSFLNQLDELETFGVPYCGGELKIPKLTRPLRMLKKFTCVEMRMTDESLQEIFKNMQNLEELSIELIEGITPDGLSGKDFPYSLANLFNLRKLGIDGLKMTKEVLAKMQFPYLKELTFCIEGRKWDLPIRDKDMHRIGQQCPNLMTVDESGEGDVLWTRDEKTRRFENQYAGSSSDEISRSSNSDLRSDECDCESDDCDCNAGMDDMMGTGGGSDIVKQCAQQ